MPKTLSLDLVSTDALLKELAARHDAIVWASMQSNPKGPGMDLAHWDYEGSLMTCRGLAEELRDRLADISRKAEEEG